MTWEPESSVVKLNTNIEADTTSAVQEPKAKVTHLSKRMFVAESETCSYSYLARPENLAKIDAVVKYEQLIEKVPDCGYESSLGANGVVKRSIASFTALAARRACSKSPIRDTDSSSITAVPKRACSQVTGSNLASSPSPVRTRASSKPPENTATSASPLARQQGSKNSSNDNGSSTLAINNSECIPFHFPDMYEPFLSVQPCQLSIRTRQKSGNQNVAQLKASRQRDTQDDLHPQYTMSTADVRSKNQVEGTNQSLSTFKGEEKQDKISKNGQTSIARKAMQGRTPEEELFHTEMKKLLINYAADRPWDETVEKVPGIKQLNGLGEARREQNVVYVIDMNKQFMPHPPTAMRLAKGWQHPRTRPGFKLAAKKPPPPSHPHTHTHTHTLFFFFL
jgi:hypothetical protein